jgi:Ca-activated chloride channel family protein
MAGQQGGRRKMDIAREALESAIGDLDGKDAVTALRAYGFDESVEWTPEASCPNTELLVGFGRDQSAAISTAAGALAPYGYTPIASSLIAAGEDLAAAPARRRLAILISDGEETCEGDPVAVAASLNSDGETVNTFIVGYDLNAEQRAQMAEVAAAGGGAYLDAPDPAQLRSAIRNIVEFAVETSERVKPSCDNPAAGGPTPQEATLLAPGIYTVGEAVPSGEARYYRIETQEGELGVVRGLIQSWRYVQGDDGPREAVPALAPLTLAVYDADGAPASARNARVRNIPGSTTTVYYADTDDRGFILGVGDNYDMLPPDSLFEVAIEPAHDGGEGDAPAGLDGADFPVVVSGEPATGHLGYDDASDVWRAEAQGPITVATDIEDAEMSTRLTVYDEASGRRLARGEGQISATAEGPVLIQIESREPALAPRFSTYMIRVES